MLLGCDVDLPQLWPCILPGAVENVVSLFIVQFELVLVNVHCAISITEFTKAEEVGGEPRNDVSCTCTEQ